MKILEEDVKKGIIKIQVEDEEDLWILYNTLKRGDVVYARTTREVKPGEGGSSRRLPMTLGLRVEVVEYQEFSDKLRVRGVVIEGPEEYGVKGHYHTIAVGVGDIIVVQREEWGGVDLERLRRSAYKKKKVLVGAFDQDEACLSLLTDQGVRHLMEYSTGLPGKAYADKNSKSLEELVEEFVENAIKYVETLKPDIVLLASPSWLKDMLEKTARSMIGSVPVFVDAVSSGGCQGVSELLRRDIVKKAVSEINIVKAREILERFKELLVKDHSRVAYGLEQVKTAVEMGAVLALIVVSELLRSPVDEERSIVHEILEKAQSTRAEVVIVPGSSDPGGEVSSFGGVIAILRYSIWA